MSKVRMYILAAVATAGIGLGETFGASAVPITGKLIGATYFSRFGVAWAYFAIKLMRA